MAEVTVRVRMNRVFTVMCDGVDGDSCLEDIADNGRLDDEFQCACNEEMEIVEATYDEPEEEDEIEDQ